MKTKDMQANSNEEPHVTETSIPTLKLPKRKVLGLTFY